MAVGNTFFICILRSKMDAGGSAFTARVCVDGRKFMELNALLRNTAAKMKRKCA